MRLLNERNEIEQILDNQTRSRAINFFDKGKEIPAELEERIKAKQEEYERADTSYKRSILDIQNLERKKTGQQLERDIQKRVKTFIEKERKLPAKRAEFNMFLRESGIALEAAIFKKQKAANVPEENYKFDIGIGMYDQFTGKYRGLDQSEEDAAVLGIDLKQAKEALTKSDQHHKELSEEVGFDVRFTPKKKKVTA